MGGKKRGERLLLRSEPLKKRLARAAIQVTEEKNAIERGGEGGEPLRVKKKGKSRQITHER